MKNTQRLFEHAKQFQGERAAIVEKHEKELQRLNRYAGSSGYEKELKQEKKRFENELSELQAKYSAHFTSILQLMAHSIDRRTLTPPTDEQMRAVEAIRLRKHVSEEELSRVAQLLKDTPLALALLDDLAEEKGHLRRFARLCPEMTNEAARRTIQRLSEGLRDFLKFDTSKAARFEEKYHSELYGRDKKPRELPKRRLFESEADFYRDFARLDDVGLKQLEAAVNNNLVNRTNE